MNATTSRHWSMATSSPALSTNTSLIGARFHNESLNGTIFDQYGDYVDYTQFDLTPYMLCIYEHSAGAVFLPVLLSVFFLCSSVGNVLVLYVILTGVHLRSMTDVCLLNLALADLLLGWTLPFLAHQVVDQWVFGDVMCKLVLGVYNIVLYCGIFFICLMGIDRYLAIVHAVYALKVRTRSFGIIAAGVMWMMGFLASFPDNMFLQEKKRDDGTVVCLPFYPKDDQQQSRHFLRVLSIFKLNVLGLFIPLLIMGFCYSQIIWRLMSSQTSKKQSIRLVLVVLIAFFCCWVPFNVASFFKALEFLDIYSSCESSKAIHLTLQATQAVSYFHSCLNPMLYVFVGVKFRRHLRRLRFFKALLPLERQRRSMYSRTSSLDERSTGV